MTISLDPHAEMFHVHGLHIKSRTIYLQQDEGDSEVNHNMAARCIKNLHVLQQLDPYGSVEVLMNCPGGSTTDGMAIYDAIKAFPGHVTGKVLGEASSMGAIILQAFDKRQAYSWARFLLHDGSMEVSGTLRDVERQVEAEKILRIETYRIYAERTGKPAKYWNRKLNHDLILSAQQALEEGLIDEII